MIFKRLYSFSFLFFVMVNVAFGQQPKLMLPIGHTGFVLDASYSPDGKYIISASIDGTAKVWNAINGQLVTDLRGHTHFVNSATFSPDGKYIVTASADETAKVWDATKGQLVATLKGHSNQVLSASFSSNGKNIITISNDNTVKVWDALSWQLQTELKGDTKGFVSASFSPDGKYIVTASRDSTAKIWNAIRGELVATLRGHTNSVNDASFSPDGEYIVTASRDNTAKIWNAMSGQLITNLEGHTGLVWSASFSPDGKYIVTASNDSTAKVWNTISGQPVADLKGHSGSVYCASFSLDGKYIVTASRDSTAKVWNANNGQLIANLTGNKKKIISAFFSPDGKRILTIGQSSKILEESELKVWNAFSGQLESDLKGHTNSIKSASFSPDGMYLITISGHSSLIDYTGHGIDTVVRVWNVANGLLVADLQGHTNSVYSTSFSPDGKYIVTASADSTAKVWDAATWKLLTNLKGHTSFVYMASFSPNGKYIVTTSADGTAKVWNTISGQLVTTFKGQPFLSGASFSTDSKYIVTASLDSTAKVWDAMSGKLLTNLKGHSNLVYNASFSPDGKYIVTASLDSTAKVWNFSNGQLVADLKGHTNEVWNASFSPDGKYIVTGSRDSTVKVWNAISGQLVADLKGYKGYIGNAAFSPDGKYIVTTSFDNTARVWDAFSWKLKKTIEEDGAYFDKVDYVNKRITSIDNSEVSIFDLETGKKLYTFFGVDSGDYLVYDNDYHYDGTPAARKMLYFTCGTEIIELDQVKDQLWIPNLAERISNGETINAKTLDQLDICGLTPEVEDGSSKADEYYFKITPRRGGLGETVLYINGIEARRYKPAELKKNAGIYELAIKKADLKNLFIAGKENLITVKAWTFDNAISSRGIKINEDKTKEATTPPNLYAVMVGISDYKGDELDLKFAAKDATDISAAVSNAAKKLLNTDSKEHVFMYNLTTAKEHYQLPEKNSIKKLLEEIGKKATANDILLIFFAGHGVMEGDKKQFYFLTSDASKSSATDAIADVGISTAELTEWMKPQNIKAQKRILIFDACNSGQAIKDFVKMGKDDQGYLAARNDDKAQQIKAIDKLNERSGLFILSASASNQNAYEMGRYSQGLLTYSLLKAIKQQPDILNEGKYLDVSRWFNAAKETVSDLSKENGARQEPQIVSNTNFNIGVVDDEVMAKIVLPMEKPLFAASNFQNSDEAADGDNLELSKLINLQLNEIAARGTDSKIVYVMATNSPDAYTLSGRYDVKGNDVTLSISIKKNNETKYRFEEKGLKGSLKELANTVVAKAAEWATVNK